MVTLKTQYALCLLALITGKLCSATVVHCDQAAAIISSQVTTISEVCMSLYH